MTATTHLMVHSGGEINHAHIVAELMHVHMKCSAHKLVTLDHG